MTLYQHVLTFFHRHPRYYLVRLRLIWWTIRCALQADHAVQVFVVTDYFTGKTNYEVALTNASRSDREKNMTVWKRAIQIAEQAIDAQ